jgi:hypothetical protein
VTWLASRFAQLANLSESHLIAGERCGDHDVATYLAHINAMKQEFLRFAADS